MSAVSKSVKQYSTFDPRYIPGCTLWLDGDDSSTITFSSGSSILTWKDKSVSANNATGATNKPTYSAITGNRNIPFFVSSSSQYMTFADNTKLPTGTSSFTTFYVSYPQGDLTTNNKSVLTWGTLTSGNGVRYYMSGPSSSISYMNFQIVGGTAITDSTNVQNIYSIFDSLTSLSGTIAYRNGIFINSVPNTYNIGTTVGYIGTYDGTSEFFAGGIAEVLIYNRVLATTERQQVEGYLAWKWGLQGNLPPGGGHPYNTNVNRGPNLSTYSPLNISGCILWLDATDESKITYSGSNVSAWLDKSTNLKNFSTTGTVTTSSPSGVRMMLTGGNGYFQNTSFVLPTSYTIFMVGYTTDGQTNSIINAAPDAVLLFRSISNSMSLFNGSGSWNLPITGYAANTNSIISFTQNNSGGGTSSAFRTGNSVGTSTGNVIVSTALYIGTRITTNDYWKGYIGEVIIFNTALSANDRQSIEGYLGWKWGLQGNLPSTHNQKNFPPLKIN
jgi:hypothetical protein